jgi:hypothetical protein
LANLLARAYEEYRWTRQYAEDTGADQVGLSQEEKDAIIAAQELAASGDDGVAVVEVDPEAAADLQRQIDEQRRLEQEAKAKLVAAA